MRMVVHRIDVAALWLMQAACLCALPALSRLEIAGVPMAGRPRPGGPASVSAYMLSPVAAGVIGTLSGWQMALAYHVVMRTTERILIVLATVGTSGVYVFPLGEPVWHAFFFGLSATATALFCASVVFHARTRRLWAAGGVLFGAMVSTHLLGGVVEGHAYYASEVVMLLAFSYIISERIVQ